MTSSEGFSCTREVQHDFSQIYDMIIIDFPGIKATEDIFEHLNIQKKALSIIPVRMICFVLEWSQRFDLMIRDINDLFSIFKIYLGNITIIITKTEKVKDVTKEKLKFQIKKKFKIDNIIFTENKTNGMKLCETLELIKQKMENIENIKIRTKDIINTVSKNEEDYFKEEREKYNGEFNESLKKFNIGLDNAKDSDLKRAIYFCFRDYKTRFLEKYTNELRNKKLEGQEIDNDSIISELLMLENGISNSFEDFRKKVEKSIDIKLNNYNGEFNRFKKCPHCGTIWFKIKGCDNIVCGRRTKIRDKFFGRFKKYIVTFFNNILSIETHDIGDNYEEEDFEFVGLTEEEKKENLKRGNKKPIQPIGCGSSLNWKEMEDCSKEILKKLRENSLEEDYYSDFLKISEKIK